MCFDILKEEGLLLKVRLYFYWLLVFWDLISHKKYQRCACQSLQILLTPTPIQPLDYPYTKLLREGRRKMCEI